ncbi:transcription factor cbf12 [Ceratobasidium sp. AG-Ba]|nr:transcription factor cbf12 [Ceratobasidium sp. AG-Ba]QRW08296.1 transcription factor cbf12 [Ceratobasidium sp. AG-Ba]
MQADIPFVGVPAQPGGTAFGSDYVCSAQSALEWDSLEFLHPSSVDPRAMSLDLSGQTDLDSALHALHAANAAGAADPVDMDESSYLYATGTDSFNPRFRADSVSSAPSLDGFLGGDYLYDSTPASYSEDSLSPDQPPAFDIMSALSALSTVPEGMAEPPYQSPSFQGSPPPFASSSPFLFPSSGTVSPGAISKSTHPSFNMMLDSRPGSSAGNDLDDLGLPYSGNMLTQFHQQNFPSFMDGMTANPAAPRGLLRRTVPDMGFAMRQPEPTAAPLTVDNTLSRLKLEASAFPAPEASADLQSFIRPYLDQYINSRNRMAMGERSVIVMSSKVAQKSYGSEKRFLCPPPTAVLIGNQWWSESRHSDDPKLAAPRVVISMSGEAPPQESSIEWTTTSGKPFDVTEPPADDTTYIGRSIGKHLFISTEDQERKKKVEALVKITAPSEEGEPERIIGTFPSRPIQVISKPSKKRQSAKNLELCVNHGSTVSLFHRLRAQTVSTKYLCVSGSGASFKGSDGAPLPGIDHRQRGANPSFVARTGQWDSFIMYIVDVTKPVGGPDTSPPPPPHPDYPSPPANAIPYSANGATIPIYYNQTVVLQCLISGVVSPVLIIRKVDKTTIAVGGGLQDGAKGVPDQYCAPGEVCGDPVSQLHKVALEVYEPNKGAPEPGTPGISGSFLSCMGEKVNTYRPVEGRQWHGTGGSGSSPGSHSPSLPDSPVMSPSHSSSEYFTHVNGSTGSSSGATTPDYPPSNDGGRVRRMHKRHSISGSFTKPIPKNRRRMNSIGSTGGRPEKELASGALWSVDTSETAVWTIVGTDQVRYNFYIPPALYDSPQTSFAGVPSKPITPFPGLVKYLAPDRAAEAPKSNCAASRAAMAKPNPHAGKQLTLYGENLKAHPLMVFFGTDPSPQVEVRCNEVMACLPPEGQSQQGRKRPIVLVRGDGVMFPTTVQYP